MARFVDPKKRDPFRNFNFRIVMGGIEVAACRKMSGLTGTVDVVKFRAGNNKASNEEMSPGRTHYEPITLESGLTTDPEFERWALLLIRHELTPGLRATDPDFRREVEIFVYDIDNNRPVKKFVLHKAWVSKYTGMSELAAEANEVLIETIEIQHEGFERVEVA
ncbi:MAG TPA: phage tail protein [Kofleriaceae bacterium]|nr:phage tail protein [Kofleriaceae bacterium]